MFQHRKTSDTTGFQNHSYKLQKCCSVPQHRELKHKESVLSQIPRPHQCQIWGLGGDAKGEKGCTLRVAKVYGSSSLCSPLNRRTQSQSRILRPVFLSLELSHKVQTGVKGKFSVLTTGGEFLLINSLRNIDNMETEFVVQPVSEPEQSACAITIKSILQNQNFLKKIFSGLEKSSIPSKVFKRSSDMSEVNSP